MDMLSWNSSVEFFGQTHTHTEGIWPLSLKPLCCPLIGWSSVVFGAGRFPPISGISSGQQEASVSRALRCPLKRQTADREKNLIFWESLRLRLKTKDEVTSNC